MSKYPLNIFFFLFLINITPACFTAAGIPEQEHDPMFPIQDEEGEIAESPYYRQNKHRYSDDQLNDSVAKILSQKIYTDILSSPEFLFSFASRSTGAIADGQLQQEEAAENTELLAPPEILPVPSSAAIASPPPLRRFSKRKSELPLEAGEAKESKSLKLSPQQALASDIPLVEKDTASSSHKKDVKNYECEICEKQFTQKSNLSAHMLTHTGEKPFECDQCDKKFAQKSNLTKHMPTHTGEKPFECDQCDKKFTRKSNLTLHMLTHTGEKSFTCTECGKGFAEKSKLITHMRIHTGEKPFECTKCDKQFTQKGNLTKHMRIHTGEKPFECDQCGKGFTEKSKLATHMRTHTGETPFACTECHKKFSQKSNLKKHMHTHE